LLINFYDNDKKIVDQIIKEKKYNSLIIENKLEEIGTTHYKIRDTKLKIYSDSLHKIALKENKDKDKILEDIINIIKNIII